MSYARLRNIKTIPASKDFLDIILSKTQRKTPTVIHRHYAISRIRDFYSRKVKFTQQNCHDRLNDIIQSFPIISDLHPFYSDLLNILYDKDHYKMALGQVNMSKNLIDNIAKEYLRLIKYGDSLYRCKTLKVIALGRMCTIIKKIDKSLKYLEEVRQHMSRIPTIDPSARTIIICGFPNVGKSSFINKITRADVEVQPYAFTTKALYVGHTDYSYNQFQVIDTPGILDHPLENRNTIEMQSITALAHIRSVVLYMMDISEQCEYSIEQQIALFKNIIPIFANRPIIIGLNKIDVITVEELSSQKKSLLDSLISEGYKMVPLSTYNDEGIMTLKHNACEKLNNFLIDQRLKSNKPLETTAENIHVSIPLKRDNVERLPVIPEKLLMIKNDEQMMVEKKTQKQLENELGEEYYFDRRKLYLLPEQEKYDIIPEIMDGKNIIDFVDPDILLRLEAIEKEEMYRDASGFYDTNEWTEEEIYDHLKAKKIKEKRELIRSEHYSNRGKTTTRTVTLKKHRLKLGNKKVRFIEDADMDDENEDFSKIRAKDYASIMRRENSTLLSIGCQENLKKTNQLSRRTMKSFAKNAKAGESDRKILDDMPKHLFSGKRKIGKTQRR